MTSKHLYFALLGGLALLIIALIGGTYGVTQLLSAESSRLVSNRLQVEVLAQQQADVVKAKAEIAKYQGLATIAKSVVPQDKDQVQTVRQIVTLAGNNGINLGSITFPASTLGGITGKPDLSQLIPVTGVTGVYALQLTVSSDVNKPVPYGQFVTFLSALEHNRRTALVQNITIHPSATNRSLVSFSLILNEYIKP